MWGGSALSNLGDGVRITALPLLASSLTRDPVAIGVVTAASFLPWIIFSPIAGVIADRSDRRWLIAVSQLGRGLAVSGFAWLVVGGNQSLVAIYLVALLIGAGEVLVDSASQAAIPMVAPGGQLEKANSRMIAVEILTNDVVGAPLGGWLFALSAAIPFGLDAVTFLGGAALVAGISRPLRAEQTKEARSLRGDIAEGFRYLWHHPLLRGLVVTISLVNLAATAASSLLVLLVLEQLDMSEVGFGLLIGVGAIGGIAGSLSAQRLVTRFGRRAMLIAPMAVEAVALAATGLAPGVILAGVGVLLSGASIGVFNVVGRSIRQAVTPDRLLGRVVATFRLFGYGVIPIGALVGGVIGRAAGVPATYLLAAGAVGLLTVAMARVVTPERLSEGETGTGR